MDTQTILSMVDHTLLAPDATWEQIRAVCDEGMAYRTASVCIPPAYVAAARGYAGDRLTLCTVIGFPTGYSTTAVKCSEAAQAVADGADEIDMVINIGWLKAGRYEDVLQEIRAVKAACDGRLLKVIVETCLLTREEKIAACRIVGDGGADYIKTSTGFSTGGATCEDVRLLRDYVAPYVKVKAAGGIADLEDARALIRAGAQRLGTSRIVKIVKQSEEA